MSDFYANYTNLVLVFSPNKDKLNDVLKFLRKVNTVYDATPAGRFYATEIIREGVSVGVKLCDAENENFAASIVENYNEFRDVCDFRKVTTFVWIGCNPLPSDVERSDVTINSDIPYEVELLKYFETLGLNVDLLN